MNLSSDELAALRDLNNTQGWALYKRIAKERIEQANQSYLADELSQEEAWEARTRVKAIMSFQGVMEEVVSGAVEQLMISIRDQMNREMIVREMVQEGVDDYADNADY